MMNAGVPIYEQSMQQLDKDELYVCPYDPVHRVAAKRFVRHIIKCRKNHPNADKSTCPFNARHIVPTPELQMHISSCPDRRLIENEINCERLTIDGDEAKGDTNVPPYSLNRNVNFSDDEDWDSEIAATESSRPNYRTVVPSSRYTWNNREEREVNGGDSSSTPRASQTFQPFPMERRPVGHPQFRSGVVGIGRGRGASQETTDKQKKTREPARPGPSGGASLAANFNVRPTTADQSPRRVGERRLPSQPPAYSEHNFESDTQEGSSASPQSSDGSPRTAVQKARKKLFKLLKEVKVIELKVAEGKPVSREELIKLNKKPQFEARLEELALE